MLKRVFISIFVFLFNVYFLNATEVIRDYKSEITVNKDGSLTFKDILSIEVKHEKINKGLIRDFNLMYNEEAYGKKIPLIYKFSSVKRNGNPEYFTVSNNYVKEIVSIYTGTEEEIEKGLNVFEFNYTVYNQISHFKEEDGIYINITGNEWDIPIVRTTALINLPKGIEVKSFDGYTGKLGETFKNFKSGKKGNQVAFSTTKAFMPYEGLTISVSFDRGVNEEYTYPKEVFIERPFVYMFLLLSIVFFYYFLLRKKYGRNEAFVVMPEYYPLKEVSPPVSGSLLMIKAEVSTKFTSIILDLAARNFISIEEKQEDFHVIRIKETKDDPSLPFDEAKILQELLPNLNDTMIIGEKEHSSKIYTAMNGYPKTEKSLIDKYMNRNSKIVGIGYFLNFILAFYGMLTSSPYILTMYIISFLMVPSLFLMISSKRAIFERLFGSLIFFSVILFTVAIGNEFLKSRLYYHDERYLMIEYFFVFLFVFLTIVCHKKFKEAIVKYTDDGNKVMKVLLGFKMFIDAVDKERYKQITPSMFETNLPYAVAFNLEEKWCEKFDFASIGQTREDILNQINFRKRVENSVKRSYSHEVSKRAVISSGSNSTSRGGGGYSSSSSSSSRGGGSSGGGSGSRGGRGR